MGNASKQRRKEHRKFELANPKPVAPVAAANGRRPHERAGTRVAVVREAHGWHDCHVTGVLIDDHGSVRVDADDPHFAGAVFECRHRRDYHVLTY